MARCWAIAIIKSAYRNLAAILIALPNIFQSRFYADGALTWLQMILLDVYALS